MDYDPPSRSAPVGAARSAAASPHLTVIIIRSVVTSAMVDAPYQLRCIVVAAGSATPRHGVPSPFLSRWSVDG